MFFNPQICENLWNSSKKRTFCNFLDFHHFSKFAALDSYDRFMNLDILRRFPMIFDRFHLTCVRKTVARFGCLQVNISEYFRLIYTYLVYLSEGARSVSCKFAIKIYMINNEVAIQMLPLKTSRLVTYFPEIARFCIWLCKILKL